MPLVYFMRHGRAELSSAGGDEARQLTAEGRAELSLTTRALQRMQAQFEVVVVSPLTRAQQTASILRDDLAPKAPLHTVAVLAPSAGGGTQVIAQQLAEVGAHGNGASTLVVGHAPDIGELVAYAMSGLLSGAPSFDAGSIACVYFQGQVRAGAGALRWMMSPAQLALIGHP